MNLIYDYVDPRNGQLRYVGQSSTGLNIESLCSIFQ